MNCFFLYRTYGKAMKTSFGLISSYNNYVKCCHLRDNSRELAVWYKLKSQSDKTELRCAAAAILLH